MLFSNRFRTWEYANDYLTPLWAIAQTYQSIIPMLPDWLWPLLTDEVVVPYDITRKMALSLLVRATLAALMALTESFTTKGLRRSWGVGIRPTGVVVFRHVLCF